MQQTYNTATVSRTVCLSQQVRTYFKAFGMFQMIMHSDENKQHADAIV